MSVDFTGAHSNPMAIGLSQDFVLLYLQQADSTSHPPEGLRQFRIKKFLNRPAGRQVGIGMRQIEIHIFMDNFFP